MARGNGFTSGAKVPNVQQHQQFQPGSHITSKLGTNPVVKQAAQMAARHTYQVTNSMRNSVSNSLNSGRKLP